MTEYYIFEKEFVENAIERTILQYHKLGVVKHGLTPDSVAEYINDTLDDMIRDSKPVDPDLIEDCKAKDERIASQERRIKQLEKLLADVYQDFKTGALIEIMTQSEPIRLIPDRIGIRK